MTYGLAANVRLRNGIHCNGSLYANFHAALLQRVSHCKGIDRGGQHTHMVGTGTLHAVTAVLQAAPEITAANNNAHLDTHLHSLLDNIADLADDVKVQTTVCGACQRLSADLQQHPLIFRLIHAGIHSHLSFTNGIYFII